MMKDRSWIAPPAVFIAGIVTLVAVWLALEPQTTMRLFDNDGRSPVELATLPLFAAIVLLVFWKCPFSGSHARRRILSIAVAIVATMAIVKELDLHNAALHLLWPDCVGADGSLVPGRFVKPNGSPLTGTPFKMRVVTNGSVPLSMKVAIIAYFVSFFGVFAAGFAYLFPGWLAGVFALDAASWSFGCFGACGVVVQIADRLPSWLNHAGGLENAADGSVGAAKALCTALEEGGEFMLAFFALYTILLAHRKLLKKT